MVRVAGVDIPGNKHVDISLQYIYGIGPTISKNILAETGINSNTKVNDLTDDEISRIRGIIDKKCKVEGELRREVNLNLKRLIEIGCYRGLRHRMGLPCHGQRTQTNARTKRGPKKTVAGRGRRRGATKK